MLEAVAARHKCVSFYHASSGTQVSTFDEATLSLGGTHGAIQSVCGIEIDGVKFEVDRARKTVTHPEHSDPAIPFLHAGRWWLQIFLCEGRYERELPTKVKVSTTSGTHEVASVIIRQSDSDIEMASRLTGRAGDRRIECLSSHPVEGTIQWSVCGREMESGAVRLKAGRNEMKLHPIHGERYGICLSSTDPFGGIEHKHMVFGETGHASGRILANRDGFWLPKTREFAYRSIIAVDHGQDDGWLQNLMGDPEIDELDIWTSVSKAQLIATSKLMAPGRRITTYAPAVDPAAKFADVVIVDPDSHLPDNKDLAFMLFMDQAQDGFQDRLELVLRRLATIPDEINVIDRAWIGSKGQPAMSTPNYGIGFSVSSEKDKKSHIALYKRLSKAGALECVTCPVRASCDAMIATPWARGITPSAGNCRTREALNGLESRDRRTSFPKRLPERRPDPTSIDVGWVAVTE